MDKQKYWNEEELETHIKANLDSEYGSAVIVAALYKLHFGHFPKIGLSGFQASGADCVISKIEPAVTQEKC